MKKILKGVVARKTIVSFLLLTKTYWIKVQFFGLDLVPTQPQFIYSPMKKSLG